MSDILDDLKIMADHCDQENGDEPCDLGMLLVRAIGEIRKLRSQPVSAAEVPMPERTGHFRNGKPRNEVCYCGKQMRDGQTCQTCGYTLNPQFMEVPMPDIAGELFDGKRVCDEADVRTYGAAREAAGYAACQDALADACCAAEARAERLAAALSALLESDKDGAIASASDDDLLAAISDETADDVVRIQAAAVFAARAALAGEAR